MEEGQNRQHGLIVNGRYRMGNGMPMEIVLHDLSRSGCQIHDRLGRLAVGQFLTIRIGPIGPIEAHVRWLNGRLAGIKISSSLNDAVLDHLRTIAQPNSASRPDQPQQPRKLQLERLPLSARERAFSDAIGAIEVDAKYREVLTGLNRKESEWLLCWRGERIHERRERPTYLEDIYVAEQLEETHELRRRNRHPF
ncbi:hypothetical protein GRI89_03210 [Altererythrobacter salegens]|uniref:PilZ domain-containing protein n=1 Tax=Croceibacterium salegens TaxID=1737568 RepID=A0A6I4SRF4_9SPHN|nr:PilZ domain-containing protein [Croceibacterium salegens]MXO58551.1 hypothetical protein [Croceibacterium salegens]